jgi:hypothetical protein
VPARVDRGSSTITSLVEHHESDEGLLITKREREPEDSEQQPLPTPKALKEEEKS